MHCTTQIRTRLLSYICWGKKFLLYIVLIIIIIILIIIILTCPSLPSLSPLRTGMRGRGRRRRKEKRGRRRGRRNRKILCKLIQPSCNLNYSDLFLLILALLTPFCFAGLHILMFLFLDYIHSPSPPSFTKYSIKS